VVFIHPSENDSLTEVKLSFSLTAYYYWQDGRNEIDEIDSRMWSRIMSAVYGLHDDG